MLHRLPLGESLVSFVNSHEVLEDVTSFRTAKLYALIGLLQKIGSPTTAFSISLRGEYDNSAKIILLNCVEAVFCSFSRNALQSYSMLSQQLRNDSETNAFRHHYSKLVLTRASSRTNIPFRALIMALGYDFSTKKHKNEPQSGKYF